MFLNQNKNQFQKLSPSFGAVCFTLDGFTTFAFRFFNPLSRFLFRYIRSFFMFYMWFLNSNYSLYILYNYFFIIYNFFFVSSFFSITFCSFRVRSVFFCYMVDTFLVLSFDSSLSSITLESRWVIFSFKALFSSANVLFSASASALILLAASKVL